MKKQILAICVLMFLCLFAIAQAPPAPPSDASNGGGNGPVGGNAPVGSATLLLIGLAGMYGRAKLNKQ